MRLCEKCDALKIEAVLVRIAYFLWRRDPGYEAMTALPARQLSGNPRQLSEHCRQLSDNFPTGDWGEVGRDREGMGRGETTSLEVNGCLTRRMRDGTSTTQVFVQ